MRPLTAGFAKGTSAVVTIPSTRAVPPSPTHTILGVVSIMGAANIEIKLPNLKSKKMKVDESRKRPQRKKPVSRALSLTINWISILR